MVNTEVTVLNEIVQTRRTNVECQSIYIDRTVSKATEGSAEGAEVRGIEVGWLPCTANAPRS